MRSMTVLITCFVALPALAQDGAGPVEELRRMYETDEAVRATLDQAFEQLAPRPDGTPNPWRGKGIEDLCSFFEEWYRFLPDTTNGLAFIEEFAWFYYRNEAGLRFVREDPGLAWTRRFVAARGEFMDSRESARGVAVWQENPATRIDEFIVPPGGFRTFNEFFTRRIKPGVRPISAPTDDSVVACPGDCIVNMASFDLEAGTRIPVKGRLALDVGELLGGSALAGRFVGGSAVSCVLMPNTYHHYHAPVSGRVVEARESVDGVLFGIEDLPSFLHEGNVGYGADFSVFEIFHRGYLVIETERFGHVAMIPVGLDTINSVEFLPAYERVDATTGPVPINKGDEVGYFQYGGSLVILLFEPGRFPALQILQGQRIGTLDDPPTERR